MSGHNFKLEGDDKSITLTFPTTPPLALKLDTEKTEELLQGLGEFRAVMKPEIQRQYSLGKKCNAILNPVWVTEPEAMQGEPILHIRDPRYGWLHYMIPRKEAQKLASFLQAQVDTPPPAIGSGKAN